MKHDFPRQSTKKIKKQTTKHAFHSQQLPLVKEARARRRTDISLPTVRVAWRSPRRETREPPCAPNQAERCPRESTSKHHHCQENRRTPVWQHADQYGPPIHPQTYSEIYPGEERRRRQHNTSCYPHEQRTPKKSNQKRSQRKGLSTEDGLAERRNPTDLPPTTERGERRGTSGDVRRPGSRERCRETAKEWRVLAVGRRGAGKCLGLLRGHCSHAVITKSVNAAMPP